MVELKRDRADEQAVDQVVDYASWVANRLANGEVDIVRPYIVAYRFPPATIARAKSAGFNRTGIKLIKYEVVNENQLEFREITE